MKPFTYTRAANVAEAAEVLTSATVKAIAGGTNLLDLMKLQVEVPETLVDLQATALHDIVDTDDGGLRIGAMVSNTDLAVHPRVRSDYAVLSRAVLAGATQQLRNKATTGGNLCQRTRCAYFTNITQPCNKREPGSGCGAIDGVAHNHAILGTSDACIATYPGDMAVALSALKAMVEIARADGQSRTVPVREFHRLPGDTPDIDNVLEAGEVITHVVLPPKIDGIHIYRKVRERSSYAFALASVAAIISVENGKIDTCQLAFGSVAAKPWHDDAISDALIGETPSLPLFEKAADILLKSAKGHGHSADKIPLVRRTLIAVLAEATGVDQ